MKDYVFPVPFAPIKTQRPPGTSLSETFEKTGIPLDVKVPYEKPRSFASMAYLYFGVTFCFFDGVEVVEVVVVVVSSSSFADLIDDFLLGICAKLILCFLLKHKEKEKERKRKVLGSSNGSDI